MLDGQVSAVVGTHTHVQTADEQIFPGGTAYLTDAGFHRPARKRFGPRNRADHPPFPHRHAADDSKWRKIDVLLHGAVIEIDDASGKSVKIQRVAEAI